MGEKLICEHSSHFSVLLPLNEACAVSISALVCYEAAEKEPSPTETESLGWARAWPGSIRLNSVTEKHGETWRLLAPTLGWTSAWPPALTMSRQPCVSAFLKMGAPSSTLAALEEALYSRTWHKLHSCEWNKWYFFILSYQIWGGFYLETVNGNSFWCWNIMWDGSMFVALSENTSLLQLVLTGLIITICVWERLWSLFYRSGSSHSTEEIKLGGHGAEMWAKVVWTQRSPF